MRAWRQIKRLPGSTEKTQLVTVEGDKLCFCLENRFLYVLVTDIFPWRQHA